MTTATKSRAATTKGSPSVTSDSKPTKSSRPAKPTIETKLMLVTPEWAAELLAFSSDWGTAHGVQVNRTFSIGHVNDLALDMINGDWEDTGVPILIDREGVIRDGQQRLAAIVKSRVSLWLNVVSGIEPTAQRVVDHLRPRRVADDLHIDGVPQASFVTATATLLVSWRNKQLMRQRHGLTSHVMHRFIDPNQEALIAAVRYADVVRRQVTGATLSVVAATYFTAHELDDAAAQKFFASLMTGANLDATDPILVLRNVMARYNNLPRKPRREYQLHQIVTAWNAWRAGKEVHYLRVPRQLTSDNFPTMK